MSNIQDPEEVERLLRNTKHPSDLAAVLMRRDTISMEDLQSAAEVDYDGARSLMSMLVRKGAIIRTSRTDYAKSSGFIDILKRLRSMDKKNEHDLTRERF